MATEQGNPSSGITAPEPLAVAARGGLLLVQELINYVSFVFRAPVALCYAAMGIVILITLQDVYPGASATVNPLVLRRFPQEIHADGPALFKFYGLLSTALYVVTLIARLILRDRLPKPRYRTKFTVSAVVATLGWGFVIWNVQYVRVADGTSRTGLALIFAFFYLLSLVAFAAALGLSRFADLICDAGARALQPQDGPANAGSTRQSG